MNKKITIYEVANQAGVAISTVSRVLNKSPNVSQETRDKVDDAIKSLKFRPQANARKLARKEPQMLAIAVPSFTTPYFNEVLKGVKDELMKMDLDIIIYNTGSRNPEDAVPSFFDRGTADALIILSIEVTTDIHELVQATQTPVVLVNSHHPAYNYFMMNDYHGGFIAGEHLVKKGFKKIGMIRAFTKNRAAIAREKGFKDALQSNGIEIEDRFFITGKSSKHGGLTEEAGFEAIHLLHNQGEMPEALFCSNDTQALGAIHALNGLGLSVPDDIALMGYDNIKLSKYLDLTTIDQQMHTIGVKATQRLGEIIKNPAQKALQQTIDPVLIERGSTNKI